MTSTIAAPVPVEQCDREAGLTLRLYTTSIKPGDYRYDRACHDFRSGEWDNKETVQAFARHRLAALASAPAGDGEYQRAADAMKERACEAHRLCYELMLKHPDIAELGDDGALHCAIHNILAVDTRDAALARPRAAVGVDDPVAIIREMVRLADMGFEQSLTEPEENGNFAVYERAKRFLALQSPPAKLEGQA